ncbi:PIN domain-containing protein [Streptomyces sp. NPDC096176]|uniref:PIN domain-containing protein n=1 Tax=Streptomyces sp. NPDC096176 TaxID=3366079 RepID=UPI0037FDB572
MWELLRVREARAAWAPFIESGLVLICEPTTAEFLRSATSPAHRDDLEERLHSMFSTVRVPGGAWSWVGTAQYKLTQKGQHRGAGPLDLLVCATAVHHGLVVLHRDNDFPADARVVDEAEVRDVRDPYSA